MLSTLTPMAFNLSLFYEVDLAEAKANEDSLTSTKMTETAKEGFHSPFIFVFLLVRVQNSSSLDPSARKVQVQGIHLCPEPEGIHEEDRIKLRLL